MLRIAFRALYIASSDVRPEMGVDSVEVWRSLECDPALVSKATGSREEDLWSRDFGPTSDANTKLFLAICSNGGQLPMPMWREVVWRLALPLLNHMQYMAATSSNAARWWRLQSSGRMEVNWFRSLAGQSISLTPLF